MNFPTLGPQNKKDIDKLEQVQQGTTKMTEGRSTCPMKRCFSDGAFSVWRREGFRSTLQQPYSICVEAIMKMEPSSLVVHGDRTSVCGHKLKEKNV